MFRVVVDVLRHMFYLRVLTSGAAAIFSFYLALWQLQMTADNPDFWLVIGAAFILGLISWVAAALESRKSDERIIAQAQQIQDLINSLPKPEPVNIQAHLQDLRSKSDADIKRMVGRLTSDMREFEANFRAAFRPLRIPKNLPEDQRDQLSRQWNDQFNLRSHARDREFAERFRSQGLALRQEMRRRLCIYPPYAIDHREIALEFGSLAGPSPISDAATVLEELARQLRD